jgi:2-iminobutanoate/2-iminopropanoate deaminase
MLRRILPLTWTALLLAACASGGPGATSACFHGNAKVEEEIGYCQAVRTGNTLHVSGTVGAGEMPEAIRKAYGSLQKTLAARGLTFADVVKETVYTTNLDAFIENKGIRKEFYGRNLPAATWVQVQRLYLPSFVVEVEVTAQFPK